MLGVDGTEWAQDGFGRVLSRLLRLRKKGGFETDSEKSMPQGLKPAVIMPDLCQG
jgi:hypothetical protein